MRFGEDYLANLELHKRTNRMLIWNGAPLYYYCSNESSTTRSVERGNIVSNICDRVKISRTSIELSKNEKLDYEDEVIFSQLKMIRDYMMEINKLSNYNKSDFMIDAKKILPKHFFEMIDDETLEKALLVRGIMDRLKYGKIIRAIALSDYEQIWKYLRRYKMMKVVIGRII